MILTNSLFCVAAVFMVRISLGCQMFFQLCLHDRFGQLLDEWGKNAILATEVFAFAQIPDGLFHIKANVGFHISSP